MGDNIFKSIRLKNNLSLEDMADELFISEEDLMKIEEGKLYPSDKLLSRISREFKVSLNTLSLNPKKLICQSCAMPLEDDMMGLNLDGSLNEDYCKWCYNYGDFTYDSLEEIVEVLVSHMKSEDHSEEKLRKFFMERLPVLKRWKKE